MKIDRNEFFKEATLRICGNLKIEEALFSTLHLLRKSIPVDRMLLDYYIESLDSMQTIAMATIESYERPDLLRPLSSKGKQQRDEKYSNQSPKVFLFNDEAATVLSAEILPNHGIKASSIMILALESGEREFGGLVLFSENDKKFNQEHVDLLSTLQEPFVIAMSNAVSHREIIKLKDLLSDDNRYLRDELHRLSGDEIIGSHFGLKEVIEKAMHVASLDSPVLLLGETGVGKDVIANLIHYSSNRKDGPFIKVNCGAIPESLIDNELFGHEKGAFTGAMSTQRGRFELADKGTIFLDEIGELPLQAQVRLLRVLQDRNIERIGGSKTIRLDIRIITATNRKMNEMVQENRFREDLWYRINVFPILVPPLRERKSDIPALLQHFIKLKSKELKTASIPSLAPGAIEKLMQYDWPGNVRELQNVVERAMILNPNGDLTFDEINFMPKPNTTVTAKQTLKTSNLDEVITNHIKQVLLKTGGKIHGPGGAAEILGLNANTLRSRITKLGIKYRSD